MINAVRSRIARRGTVQTHTAPQRLPVDQVAPPPQNSARSRLYATIRRQLDLDVAATGQVRLPVVTKLVQEELESDDDFLHRYWMESCQSAVYEHVRIVCGRTRLPVLGHQEITADGEPVAPPPRSFNWDLWLEHADDRHVTFKRMTKANLLQAAAEREARGEHELHVARFERYLAERMRDDQTVGEVFSDEQLDEIERTI